MSELKTFKSLKEAHDHIRAHGGDKDVQALVNVLDFLETHSNHFILRVNGYEDFSIEFSSFYPKAVKVEEVKEDEKTEKKKRNKG